MKTLESSSSKKKDCSMAFLYMLCSISILTNLQKFLGLLLLVLLLGLIKKLVRKKDSSFFFCVYVCDFDLLSTNKLVQVNPL